MRLIDADRLLEFIGFDGRVIAPEEHAAQDIVMMIQTAPTIAPPPNAPLTLEQLRKMDGEPVWVQCLSNEDYSGWIIADLCFNGVATKYFYAYFDYYGEEWLAYRRKPEKGPK